MSDLNDIDTVDIEKVVYVENGGEEPVQASPDPLKSIISAVEPEAVPADELRLPFLFARDKGVLLASDNGNVYLFLKEQPSMDVLLEVRRFAGRNFGLKKLPAEDFDNLLTDLYQNDDSEAQRIASNMGDDVED